MSNLILNPVATWHDDINQVEITEPILGGDGGNANPATRQLAENILWLKHQMDNQISEAYAIGDIYTTTINHADAAAVATHHGYGTWERYAEGRTQVGYSTKTTDLTDYKTMGNEFGANFHQLTIEETASHKHTFDSTTGLTERSIMTATANLGTDNYRYTNLIVSSDTNNKFAAPIGGDLPHNNIQPSIVVAYWLRTA